MYEVCCLVNPNCNTKYGYYYKPNEIHIINILNEIISKKEIYKAIFPRLVKFYVQQFLPWVLKKKSYVRSQL